MRRDQRGFTLLELMVVVSILVLISAAIPLALNRGLPGRRVAAATEQLIAAIHDAQSKSATTGLPVRVAMPVDWLRPSTAATVTDQGGRPLDALWVFPDGSASSARFEIVDGQSRQVVTLSGLTGRTRREPDR